MSRDAIYIQMDEIRREMAGISPKTETWKNLNKQLSELSKKTGGFTINSMAPQGLKKSSAHKNSSR